MNHDLQLVGCWCIRQGGVFDWTKIFVNNICWSVVLGEEGMYILKCIFWLNTILPAYRSTLFTIRANPDGLKPIGFWKFTGFLTQWNNYVFFIRNVGIITHISGLAPYAALPVNFKSNIANAAIQWWTNIPFLCHTQIMKSYYHKQP